MISSRFSAFKARVATARASASRLRRTSSSTPGLVHTHSGCLGDVVVVVVGGTLQFQVVVKPTLDCVGIKDITIRRRVIGPCSLRIMSNITASCLPRRWLSRTLVCRWAFRCLSWRGWNYRWSCGWLAFGHVLLITCSLWLTVRHCVCVCRWQASEHWLPVPSGCVLRARPFVVSGSEINCVGAALFVVVFFAGAPGPGGGGISQGRAQRVVVTSAASCCDERSGSLGRAQRVVGTSAASRWDERSESFYLPSLDSLLFNLINF